MGVRVFFLAFLLQKTRDLPGECSGDVTNDLGRMTLDLIDCIIARVSDVVRGIGCFSSCATYHGPTYVLFIWFFPSLSPRQYIY